MTNNKLTKRFVPIFAVLLSAGVIAMQDIWISNLTKQIDPLFLVFWNFVFVFALAFLFNLFRKPRHVIPPEAIFNLIGLNFTTAIAWIFTFYALTSGSPAVVSAGTLSAPLLIILVLFENNRFSIFEAFILFALLFIGLLIGSFDNSSQELAVNFVSLTYCLLASFGLVGCSHFLRKLNILKFNGNVVLQYRFILLLVGIFIYFLVNNKSLAINLNLFLTILVLSLVTTYIPLLAIYFAHGKLSIFLINLLLALTPIFSVFLIWVGRGFGGLSYYHLGSVILVVIAVYYGYFLEARREPKNNSHS